MTKSQEKYLKELEKYKDVVIEPGLYYLRDSPHIKYRVSSINDETNEVSVVTIKSNNSQKKTLHWCRKYLIKCE